MNNTTTKRNLALAAIFMAAILAVGTFATTTTTIATTQSAFAYPQKKKGGDENSRNGNTITIQKCKQAAIQSGFDNNQGQECKNLICTHPGEKATCVQEGASAVTTNAATPTPAKLTCEECLTKFLNAEQRRLVTGGNLEQFCAGLSNAAPILEDFERLLTRVAEITEVPIDQAALIQCLQNAAIFYITVEKT
jgi:hypothetical protein